MCSKRAITVTTEVMGCIRNPQNGGLEGQKHFSNAASSPTLLRTQFTGTLNGNVISPKEWPKTLGLSSPKAFATKTLRTVDDDDDDGSLPCTPDQQSEIDMDVSGCPGVAEVLDNDTIQLIKCFLMDYTGLSSPRCKESNALSTMKRVVGGLLEKHRYAYRGMINKLSLEDRGGDVTFVSDVAKNLFADQTTNWGRIASLVTFGAVVCQYMKEEGRSNCVELVGQEISSYLLSEQREWLVKNNSWDGFVEFFRVSDPESTVRNTLMAFAGVAGIGALALLIR